MANLIALTTVDNPYDPINDFERWFVYDTTVLHYNTCDYLARLVPESSSLTDQEESSAIEEAIDEIILNDFIGIYKKVKHPEGVSVSGDILPTPSPSV